jgi:hypothetical protein
VDWRLTWEINQVHHLPWDLAASLQNTLTKIMLGDVAGFLTWRYATAQFTVTTTVVDAVRARLEPVTVTM